MERMVVLLVVFAIAFILVSKFIGESTVRLIFQVILGAALVWTVLRYAGLA